MISHSMIRLKTLIYTFRRVGRGEVILIGSIVISVAIVVLIAVVVVIMLHLLLLQELQLTGVDL